MYHPGGKNHIRGVALFLDNKLSPSMEKLTPVSGRIPIVKLRHRYGHMSIVVVYAPTKDASHTEKDSFYNQLEPLVLSTPCHDQLFILGGLNAVSGTDRLGYEAMIGSHGSGAPNDNTHRLLNLCSMVKLVIAGSFFRRLDIHRRTWISYDGHTRKGIDNILARDISFIMRYRLYRGAEPPANSDHRLV